MCRFGLEGAIRLLILLTEESLGGTCQKVMLLGCAAAIGLCSRMDDVRDSMARIDDAVVAFGSHLVDLPNPEAIPRDSEVCRVMKHWQVFTHRKKLMEVWRELVVDLRRINILLKVPDSILYDSDFEDELEFIERGAVGVLTRYDSDSGTSCASTQVYIDEKGNPDCGDDECVGPPVKF